MSTCYDCRMHANRYARQPGSRASPAAQAAAPRSSAHVATAGLTGRPLQGTKACSARSPPTASRHRLAQSESS
eukprot:scaffold23648_cov29-Prasinocladus_malaysianus.AAC.1